MPPDGKRRHIVIMEVFIRKDRAECRNHGTGHRRREQAENLLQSIEIEGGREVALNDCRGYESFRAVAQGKAQRGPDVSIAKQVCGDRRSKHRRYNRQPRLRSESNQDAGRYARRGPEHRDAVGLQQQPEAQARC